MILLSIHNIDFSGELCKLLHLTGAIVMISRIVFVWQKQVLIALAHLLAS